jgi:tRNA G18 (ribose-2'-O)-methylase SpoU
MVRVGALGDHPLLEDYRNLRDGDVARTRGAFIAESEVVLRVLLERGRFPVRSILVAEPRLARLGELLSRPQTAPVFVAPPAVLDAIVGFHIHRGVLAAGERAPLPPVSNVLAALGPGPRTVVVLEGLTNHDNVGGVFRNAAAFGVDAVLYDQESCDPLYRKAIRVSVGATLFVPFTRTATTGETLEALGAAGFVRVALSPRADADDLREAAAGLPERVALVLGSEGPGLRGATLAACDRVLRIPMAGGFDSLNVATASGVALYALDRRPR